MDKKSLIYDLDFAALLAFLKDFDEPAYRVDQIWQGLYKSFWNSPDEFFILPRDLRLELSRNFEFSHLNLISSVQSRDLQTKKCLFKLTGGGFIEAVLMRYRKRKTLCISTQIGCAMGCTFCATGQMGFHKNLTSGQIIEQIIHFARELEINEEVPTNIVMMGMGEPFHNYRATLDAIDRLTDPKGFSFGARRFTISTVGLVPAILKFAEEKRQVNLAVSLHAADDDLRSSMLPINQKYPLDVLLDACRKYVDLTGRRITFEWALIQDTNDSPESARKLVNLVKGLNCHVNVIPLNPTPGFEASPSSDLRARSFCKVLNESGVPCTVRVRRGIEINAGCGQLAIQERG